MSKPLHRVIMDEECCGCEEGSDRAERLQFVFDQLGTILEELDDLSEHQAAAHIGMAIHCLEKPSS